MADLQVLACNSHEVRKADRIQSKLIFPFFHPAGNWTMNRLRGFLKYALQLYSQFLSIWLKNYCLLAPGNWIIDRTELSPLKKMEIRFFYRSMVWTSIFGFRSLPRIKKLKTNCSSTVGRNARHSWCYRFHGLICIWLLVQFGYCKFHDYLVR